MIKVFYLDQADTAAAYYRIYIVNNELLRQKLAYSTVAGAISNKTFKTKEDMQKYFLEYLIRADIVIAQMPSKLEILPLLVLAKQLGKPLIIEVDDLVHNLHGGFSQAKKDDHAKIWNIRRDLWKLADGFICSTGYLAKTYAGMFAKPAWVFENYLDFEDSRWDRHRFDNAKTVIGWMGGDSHASDLKIVEPVIKEILKDYDVQFQFVGFCPLKQDANVRFIPTDGSINNYTPMIAQFDIGIIPLADNEFNLAKTDLKFLEYSRLKVATIASKVNVYKGVKNNFNGILVRNKTQDWIKAITTLIEDKELRQQLATNAYEYVKDNRNIKTNAYKYLDILKKINDLRSHTQKAG